MRRRDKAVLRNNGLSRALLTLSLTGQPLFGMQVWNDAITTLGDRPLR
jgi:hypothetical protein